MQRTWIRNAVAALCDCDTSIWHGIWDESILRSIVCLSSRGWA
jgi:hypothetical protein